MIIAHRFQTLKLNPDSCTEEDLKDAGKRKKMGKKKKKRVDQKIRDEKWDPGETSMSDSSRFSNLIRPNVHQIYSLYSPSPMLKGQAHIVIGLTHLSKSALQLILESWRDFFEWTAIYPNKQTKRNWLISVCNRYHIFIRVIYEYCPVVWTEEEPVRRHPRRNWSTTDK